MAYFGRKAKKPGSVPGSQAGGVRADQAARQVAAAWGQLGRPARAARVNRVVRNQRNERKAR